MLYAILKILFRITFRFFFRQAKKEHEERFPAQGPLIICANHPGAFLDPVVVATLTSRRVFFLAKASAFKGKFASKLLSRLNIIPVYRAQDDPSQMHKNQETFVRCFEHLGKGGALLIFPEGTSITERKLRPLKTGTARIALGTMEKYNYEIVVKIICIGLNYDDPHSFRKDVLLNFSEPINAGDYADDWKKKGFAAAEELTAEIRRRLEAQLIHIPEKETEDLVTGIEKLYRYELLKRDGLDADDVKLDFDASKRILDTVNYFRTNDPERVRRIHQEIRDYFWKLKELGLSDRFLHSGSVTRSRLLKNVSEIIFLVALFPVFLAGAVLNFIPFFFASLLSRRLVSQREFTGAIGAAAGMLFFLFWYTAIGILSWHFLPGHWMMPVSVVICPFAGLFAWIYHRTWHYIRRRWKTISMFYRNSEMISSLILKRKELIREFEAAAEEWRSARKG